MYWGCEPTVWGSLQLSVLVVAVGPRWEQSPPPFFPRLLPLLLGHSLPPDSAGIMPSQGEKTSLPLLNCSRPYFCVFVYGQMCSALLHFGSWGGVFVLSTIETLWTKFGEMLPWGRVLCCFYFCLKVPSLLGYRYHWFCRFSAHEFDSCLCLTTFLFTKSIYVDSPTKTPLPRPVFDFIFSACAYAKHILGPWCLQLWNRPEPNFNGSIRLNFNSISKCLLCLVTSTTNPIVPVVRSLPLCLSTCSPSLFLWVHFQKDLYHYIFSFVFLVAPVSHESRFFHRQTWFDTPFLYPVLASYYNMVHTTYIDCMTTMYWLF